MGWEIEWWEAMKLTRRTLLQSLASLFPLSALGLGRAPNQSGTASPRLPEPPGGGIPPLPPGGAREFSYPNGGTHPPRGFRNGRLVELDPEKFGTVTAWPTPLSEKDAWYDEMLIQYLKGGAG